MGNTALSMASTVAAICQILLVFVLSSAHGETPEIPKRYQIDGYLEFESLSKVAAIDKGMKMAKADFKDGIYRLLVYGKRAISNPDEDYLRKKYSVYTIPIAGCLVSDGILGAAEGYNGTIKALLLKKYEKDIFEEAKVHPVAPDRKQKSVL